MERSGRIDVWAVAVFCVAAGAVVFAHWSAFIDPWVMNDDARQHTYWMRQFTDPELFRGDLIADYARNYQPWGWLALYRIAAPLVDPVTLGKLLPVPLFALAALAVYGIARSLSTRFGGVFAAALFIATPAYLDRFAGGHPRAFGFPLLGAFLLALVARRPFLAGLLLVAQTLFYPVLFPLCAGTWFLCLCFDAFAAVEGGGRPNGRPNGGSNGRPNARPNGRSNALRGAGFRPLLVPGLAVLAGAGVLVAKFEVSVDPRIGPIATRAELERMPEVRERGRYEVLPTESVVRLVARNLADAVVRLNLPGRERLGGLHLLVEPLLVGAAVAYLAWMTWRRREVFPRTLGAAFAASLVCFGVAEAVLLRLFLPKRYLEYPVKLVALLLLAVAVGRLTQRIADSRRRRVVQVALLGLVAIHVGGIREAGLSDLSEGRPVLEALAELPKDTLVAAHPSFADNIPTFARRSVYIDFEHSHPWYPVYWATLSERTWNFFDLYYAADRASLEEACERTGIDVVVVDRRHFETISRPYFEPFGSILAERLQGRDQFALRDVDAGERIFDAPPYSIVRCPESRPDP